MSTRWTRALLRLYPRRVRERYGSELTELQDELRARGELSRIRLLRDVIVGALVSRTKRQRAAFIAGLVGAALLTAAALGEWNQTTPAARYQSVAVLVAQATPTTPRGSVCFVGGTQCSVSDCTVFIANAATVAQTATVATTATATPGGATTGARRHRPAAAACISHARVVSPHIVFVATPVSRARRRR